jgi:hypothetical protein
VRILVGASSSMVMVMVMVTFDGVFNTVVGFVSIRKRPLLIFVRPMLTLALDTERQTVKS